MRIESWEGPQVKEEPEEDAQSNQKYPPWIGEIGRVLLKMLGTTIRELARKLEKD